MISQGRLSPFSCLCCFCVSFCKSWGLKSTNFSLGLASGESFFSLPEGILPPPLLLLLCQWFQKVFLYLVLAQLPKCSHICWFHSSIHFLGMFWRHLCTSGGFLLLSLPFSCCPFFPILHCFSGSALLVHAIRFLLVIHGPSF